MDTSGDMVASSASWEESLLAKLQVEARRVLDDNMQGELFAGDNQRYTLFPLHSALLSGVVVVWDDRREEQKRALQVEGIAHDINNLLAVVQGHLELLDGSQERAGASLIEALWTLGRAEELVRRLGPDNKGRSGVTSVKETLEHLASFLANGRYPVQWIIDQAVPPVSIAPPDFVEIFQNLLQNACDAMPDGGPLAIEVRTLDNQVSISVRDYGAGIDENVVHQLFLPHVTTKAIGRGLGLYRARELVEQYQGHIEVTSQSGVGTSFIVTLPGAVVPGC